MRTTLLVTNSANALIVTSSETIMQRSKLAHELVFYITDTYLDVYSTSSATVSLEILAPNGKRKTEILTAEPTRTKEGYLTYIYKLDVDYTTASGNLELGMSITYQNTSDASSVIREIQGCNLTITPISQWTTQIDNDNLTDLQQKITELTNIATAIVSGNAGASTVSDIAVGTDDNGFANLHLTNAVGTQIGAGITVTDSKADVEDGTADAIVDLGKL